MFYSSFDLLNHFCIKPDECEKGQVVTVQVPEVNLETLENVVYTRSVQKGTIGIDDPGARSG